MCIYIYIYTYIDKPKMKMERKVLLGYLADIYVCVYIYIHMYVHIPHTKIHKTKGLRGLSRLAAQDFVGPAPCRPQRSKFRV